MGGVEEGQMGTHIKKAGIGSCRSLDGENTASQKLSLLLIRLLDTADKEAGFEVQTRSRRGLSNLRMV